MDSHEAEALTAPLLESCRPRTWQPEIASGRWIFRGLGGRITRRPTMSSVFLSRRRSPLLNGIAQGLSPGAAIAQPIAPPPFSHSQRRSRNTAGTCSSAVVSDLIAFGELFWLWALPSDSLTGKSPGPE